MQMDGKIKKAGGKTFFGQAALYFSSSFHADLDQSYSATISSMVIFTKK